MATPLILHSSYRRRPDATAKSSWFGTFTLEVAAADGGDATLPAGTRLALWCAVLLEPSGGSVVVVERLAGHVVMEPADTSDDILVPWLIDDLRATFPARHANDGPEAAWLVLPDGTTVELDVDPCTAVDPPRPRPPTAGPTRPPTTTPSQLLILPHPRHVEFVGRPPAAGRAVTTAGPSSRLWEVIADLGRRAGLDVLEPIADHPLPSDDALRRESTGAADGEPPITVSLSVDEQRRDEWYRLDVGADSAALVGGSERGLRHGLVTLTRLLAGRDARTATGVSIVDEPTLPFRAVHLDLARQWLEPDVVERLIDVAAWRKLNVVHLHLTDDEGWRFGVDGYPSIAELGGTRGHGLALPPLCGSGPAPSGRTYTDAEIARWVGRADDLGVALVPEVDVPAHVHAALVAVPQLRDPDDTSTAMSVQRYPNNVLVPGRPATMPFLEAVFSTLSRLFPNSPVFHIGGDEVPADAWAGSPAAQAYAAGRGVTTTAEISTEFHRDVIEMIRTTTGRTVAMWEEAAFAGVEPSAYAVAWTSAAAGERLARLGHRAVMAPGQAYYLDMAPGRDWELPGGSWAGNVTLDDTCAFDPFAGWPDVVGEPPYGVQACIWGEHVHDLDILDRLTFPRLDAVAERAWTGSIAGGPDNLATRAAPLPRFTT